MFALTLSLAEHVRHYSISTATSGWEIRLEEDSKLRRLDRYHDWHRVERALELISREASLLLASGWQVVDSPSVDR